MYYTENAMRKKVAVCAAVCIALAACVAQPPELPPTTEGASDSPVSISTPAFAFAFIRKGCSLRGAKIHANASIAYPYFQMAAVNAQNQTMASFFVQCEPVVAGGTSYCKVGLQGTSTTVFAAGPLCRDWERFALVN